MRGSNKVFLFILVFLIGTAAGWVGKHMYDINRNNAFEDNITVAEQKEMLQQLAGTYAYTSEDECPRFVFTPDKVTIYCYKIGPVIMDGVVGKYRLSSDGHVINIPLHMKENDGFTFNHTVVMDWNGATKMSDEHGEILVKKE